MRIWNKRAALALTGLVGACGPQIASAVLAVGPGCRFDQLQAAIDAASGSDAFITVTAGFSVAPISTGKTLHITGGVTSCTDDTVIGMSTLKLERNTLGPVVTLTGQARFDLHNFIISGGKNANHNGGGITFQSGGDHGHIELHNVVISDNNADKGGGIFFDGRTGTDDLVLDHVQVKQNFAFDGGGGIRIQGDTHLDMDAASSIIDNTARQDNEDDGRGGGLQMLDDSTADVFGAIDDNQARYGGGISLHDSSFLTATFAEITGNTASNSGGGIFIIPRVAFSSRFDGTGVDISRNTAANGGAVYAEANGAGEADFFLEGNDGCASCRNTVSSNTTTQEDGATIVMQDGGVLRLNRVEARSNESDFFVRTFNDVLFRGRSDLIADNGGPNGQLSHAVFAFSGDSAGDIYFSTIADNSINGNGSVFNGSTTNFTLQGDIIWQPGIPTLASLPTSATSFIDDLMQDASTFDPTQFNAFGNVQTLTDPEFVDEIGGDYQLLQTSPAVDFAADPPPDFTFDLLGNARGLLLIGRVPYDAGAYELQELQTDPPPVIDDHIFDDDFDGDH